VNRSFVFAFLSALSFSQHPTEMSLDVDDSSDVKVDIRECELSLLLRSAVCVFSPFFFFWLVLLALGLQKLDEDEKELNPSDALTIAGALGAIAGKSK
jgi:hypothetical protein